MKIRDWYFQGWERREDENGKNRLVYTGEYYSFPGGAGRVKAPCAGMSAALLALYLAVALRPGEGGRWHIAAIPQLLEIIPLIYLVMGAVCLLCAPEKMTFRGWYTSVRRLKNAALWSCVFSGLMTAVQAVYLLFIGEGFSLLTELLYLAGELGCAALSFGLFRFIQKHPCSRSVDGPQKE